MTSLSASRRSAQIETVCREALTLSVAVVDDLEALAVTLDGLDSQPAEQIRWLAVDLAGTVLAAISGGES